MNSANTVIPDTSVETACDRQQLFYDGDCSFCVRLAERLGRALGRRRIELVPLQAPGTAKRLRISGQDLMNEMRLRTPDGQVWGGAEAALRIARQLWWGWPLHALSRLPDVMPVLARIYRAMAGRRSCNAGRCRGVRPDSWAGWLPLAVLPLIVLGLKWVLSAWAFMWLMALAIFLGCKWLTWRKAIESGLRPGLGRSLAYLLGWPGMDGAEFLGNGGLLSGPISGDELLELGSGAGVAGASGAVQPAVDRGARLPEGSRGVRAGAPAFRGYAVAVLKTVFGAALVWGGVRRIPDALPLVAGWVGLIGLVFLLHFGLIHLLSLGWRGRGIAVQPIMSAPFPCSSPCFGPCGWSWPLLFLICGRI